MVFSRELYQKGVLSYVCVCICVCCIALSCCCTGISIIHFLLSRSSDITFVADDILILPDYPKELDGNLEVAYTVLMPQGSGVTGGAMIPAAVALSAAMLYKDDLELMTGLTVEKMEQLSPPGVSQGQASEEVVISSVVVCGGVALIVGAIVGVM